MNKLLDDKELKGKMSLIFVLHAYYYEELEKIKSMGGLEKLLDEFKKRLEEQKGRHEGGDKWVGTGGTSPYGNSGMNPEGIRVGGEGKQNKAVKVWEKRDFKNLDDSIELGTRNIKIALRRLRKFVRESHNEEFDLDGTILNSADDLIFSLNVLLSELGQKNVSTNQVNMLVGNGALAMIKKAFEINNVKITKLKIINLKNFLNINSHFHKILFYFLCFSQPSVALHISHWK